MTQFSVPIYSVGHSDCIKLPGRGPTFWFAIVETEAREPLNMRTGETFQTQDVRPLCGRLGPRLLEFFNFSLSIFFLLSSFFIFQMRGHEGLTCSDGSVTFYSRI